MNTFRRKYSVGVSESARAASPAKTVSMLFLPDVKRAWKSSSIANVPGTQPVPCSVRHSFRFG